MSHDDRDYSILVTRIDHINKCLESGISILYTKVDSINDKLLEYSNTITRCIVKIDNIQQQINGKASRHVVQVMWGILLVVLSAVVAMFLRV